MIAAEEIKILVAGGEAYNTEFKVAVTSKVRELPQGLFAFATIEMFDGWVEVSKAIEKHIAQ